MDKEKIVAVIDLIITGLSLQKACQKIGIDAGNFIHALDKYSDLQQSYAHAREICLELKLSKIDVLENECKQEVRAIDDPKRANAIVQAYKIQIDNIKWELSKLLPKKYGDLVRIAGDADNPLKTTTELVIRTVNTLGGLGDAPAMEASRKLLEGPQ